MSTLPDAELQNPACGVCEREIRCYSRDEMVCEHCQLAFDDKLAASFLNPNDPVCGVSCDNSWHGPHRIKRGHGYECGTCQLPASHEGGLHWTGCRQTEIGEADQ